MKSSAIAFIILSLLLAPLSLFLGQGLAQTKSDQRVEMEVGINREHRDVGLKRMEIIDKALSRDLVERKLGLVGQIEESYNKKILQLINSLIPAIHNNKVMTHLDVNFLAPDFEAEVHASQKVAVSLIIQRDAFESWVEQNSSSQEAMAKIRDLLKTTFKIPVDNISILVVN